MIKNRYECNMCSPEDREEYNLDEAVDRRFFAAIREKGRFVELSQSSYDIMTNDTHICPKCLDSITALNNAIMLKAKPNN